MPLFKLGFPLLAAALAALTVAVLSADFSESAWRYYRPVLLPSGLADDSLVELVPEVGVFPFAALGLADLRVVEVVSQRETQFKLLVERGEHRRASITAKMLDMSYKAGESTSFVLDLEKEGVLHSELELRTTSRNFQRDVVVEGSIDGLDWRVLKTDGRIFDFTIDEAGEDQGFSVGDTRINYPASTVRYLKVTIDEPEQDPIVIDGAQVFFAQQFAPKRTSLPAEIVSREEDPEQNQTLLVLDLGSPGFPVNQLFIATEQENFHRRVNLEASSDSVNWRPVSKLATIFSFNAPLFVGSDLSINFPEIPSRYYRLTIINQDNSPLSIRSVEASGYLRRLIFSARSGGDYRLYYGNPGTRAPSYEIEQLFPYLITDDLPAVELGPHTANSEFALPPERQKPFTERQPWLILTVVGIAALVIGAFLTSLLRQVRTMLPPPEND